MTLDSKTTDTFAHDLHRRITELIRSADPTIEEINRLFDLAAFCEGQAHDLRTAGERRLQQMTAWNAPELPAVDFPE